MRLKAKKSNELVADYIESLIEKNEFLAGDKLPSIKELSDMFEVSIGTVREAIHILKTKGLIDIRQGEGTFVRKLELSEISTMMNIALIQKNDLKELMDFRKILEIGAVQLAVQNRTEDNLKVMKDALHDFDVKGEGNNEIADLRFHLSIASATQNTLVQFLYESISPVLQSLMRRYCQEDLPAEDWNDHHLIYEGILERDVQKAIRSIEHHLDKARQRAFPEETPV